MPNHDPYLAWSTTCPVSVSPKRPLTLIDDLQQALGMPVVHRVAEGTEVPAWHPVDTSVGALRMLVRDALHQAVSERIYTNKGLVKAGLEVGGLRTEQRSAWEAEVLAAVHEHRARRPT